MSGKGSICAVVALLAVTGCSRHHGASTLIGTWNGSLSDAKSGATVNITSVFNADGTHVETVTGPGVDTSMTCSYTAQNGVLTEQVLSGTINGQPVPAQLHGLPIRSTYTLDGDTMTSSQPGKATITFHRS